MQEITTKLNAKNGFMQDKDNNSKFKAHLVLYILCRCCFVDMLHQTKPQTKLRLFSRTWSCYFKLSNKNSTLLYLLRTPSCFPGVSEWTWILSNGTPTKSSGTDSSSPILRSTCRIFPRSWSSCAPREGKISGLLTTVHKNHFKSTSKFHSQQTELENNF